MQIRLSAYFDFEIYMYAYIDIYIYINPNTIIKIFVFKYFKQWKNCICLTKNFL